MRLLKYINESSNIRNKALEWLEMFILTSKTTKPSNDIIRFLQKYPQKVKNIYRGIGLIYQRIDKKNVEAVNALNVDDILPDYLARPTGVSSYTKKKGVAKGYSEGSKRVVVQGQPDKKSILLDLEMFAKTIEKEGDHPFDKNDLNYMKTDKEVIIIEPIKTKIIFTKGSI